MEDTFAESYDEIRVVVVSLVKSEKKNKFKTSSMKGQDRIDALG